jgi:hypothetical protein
MSTDVYQRSFRVTAGLAMLNLQRFHKKIFKIQPMDDFIRFLIPNTITDNCNVLIAVNKQLLPFIASEFN